MRRASDPRAGRFLKQLAGVRASRILISTRLYPYDLEINTGKPRPNCDFVFLEGLSNDDALALWKEFGVTGSRDKLLQMFRSFANHPLLLQALAGEIAKYRHAPGDFDCWQKDNPTFNPFQLSLTQAKTHIMEFALKGLSEAERQVLQTIAAFRMSTKYDTLRDLFVKKKSKSPFWKNIFQKTPKRIFQNDYELDSILTNLENRGLLGWDRQNDCYDIHPVVRGVVYISASEEDFQQALIRLKHYFEASPKIGHWRAVKSL